MTTYIRGVSDSLGSSTGVLSARRVISMTDKIFLLEPEAAPLYVLVSRLKKNSVYSYKHSWLEDVLNAVWTYLTSQVTTNTSTIKVGAAGADYAIVRPYDILRLTETGEQVLVTSVDTTNSKVKVTRSYGTTSKATQSAGSASNNNVLVLGSAFKEGSAVTALQTVSTQTVERYNYTQIFRKSVELSKTLANSKLYGGSDRMYQRKKKGIELMKEFQNTFYWGEQKEDTSNSRHTMAGIYYYLKNMSGQSSNVNGPLTETNLESFLRSVFRYGTKNRTMFCAPKVTSAISQIAQGRLRLIPKDQTFGLHITQWQSPHGTLNFVNDVVLEQEYAGYAFCLEMGTLTYLYLQDRDVKLNTNIQNPGDDKYTDEYLAEISLQMENAEKSGYIYGITG